MMYKWKLVKSQEQYYNKVELNRGVKGTVKYQFAVDHHKAMASKKQTEAIALVIISGSFFTIKYHGQEFI